MSPRVMKVYSAEFKADVFALYLSDPKNTFEGVGRDLGISRETLRNWVRAERARTGRAAGTGGSPRAAQADNARRHPPRAGAACDAGGASAGRFAIPVGHLRLWLLDHSHKIL